jgi:hypothetical protein
MTINTLLRRQDVDRESRRRARLRQRSIRTRRMPFFQLGIPVPRAFDAQSRRGSAAQRGDGVMGESVRKVNHYSMQVPDKPGAAFKVLATLVSAGINLLGCSGTTKGKRAQLDVVPDDTRKFVTATRKAKLTFVENRSGYLLQGEGDRPGVLASKLKVLADAGINVTGVDALSIGDTWGAILWVGDEDVARAGKHLRASIK